MEYLKNLLENKMLLIGVLLIAGLAFYFFVYKRMQESDPRDRFAPNSPEYRPPPEEYYHQMMMAQQQQQQQQGSHHIPMNQQEQYQQEQLDHQETPPTESTPNMESEEDYALPGEEDDLQTELEEQI